MKDMDECIKTLRVLSKQLDGVGFILAALAKFEETNSNALAVAAYQLLDAEENVDNAIKFLSKQVDAG